MNARYDPKESWAAGAETVRLQTKLGKCNVSLTAQDSAVCVSFLGRIVDIGLHFRNSTSDGVVLSRVAGILGEENIELCAVGLVDEVVTVTANTALYCLVSSQLGVLRKSVALLRSHMSTPK